ncbi:hypothetical protein [Actinomyces faecalis]|uniref:hypothetical protein n=1 Tax=Actinomyces faecalis TaxID=2722820 RepID=UPI0015522EE7|nr:hypothetical protein [Actinomyces faecalis]
MTSPNQPLSAPSPADLPTTVMTPAEAKVAAEETAPLPSPLTSDEDAATTVLPGASQTQALSTAGTSVPQAQEGWSMPATDDEIAPTDPLEAIRSTRPWPGEHSADEVTRASGTSASSTEQALGLGADRQDPDAVWSASTLARDPEADQPARRPGPRPGTLLWGLILATIGVVLLATGLGLRIDPVSAAIVLLAAAGAALLVIALMSRRRPAR